MNHLGHLLVSNDNEAWIGGALAADEFRGAPPASYSDDAVRAVSLHRHLDAFTDSHPVTGETRAIFAEYRHYSRVLVDVFYDHILALEFERYSAEPLPEFARRMYAGLETARSWLPAALSARIPMMIADDFLVRYRTRQQVIRTLGYLSSRFSRRIDLVPSVTTFEAERETIAAHARRFYPEMIQQAQREKERLKIGVEAGKPGGPATSS